MNYAATYLYKLRLLLLVSTLMIFQQAGLFAQENSEDFFGTIPFPNDKEITALEASPDNLIFAGSYGQGMLVSTNNGLNWVFKNNGLTSQYITAIAFGAEDEVFAGTYDGGVFRTTDNGTNWVQVNTGLRNLKIRAVAVSPNGDVYAGTLGSGVWRSTDKGLSWIECNNHLYYKNISAITIAIDSSIVIGTYGGGIYRSRNHGADWTHTAVGERYKFINDFVQDPTGHIWAATNGAGILFSVDRGGSWTESKDTCIDNNVTCLGITDMDEVIAGTRARGIFIFDKKIEVDWIETNITQNSITKIIRTPSNLLFAYITGQGLYQSLDKGRTWYYRYLPNFSPVTITGAGKNGLVYSWKQNVGTYRSTDYGSTWTLIPLISQNLFAFEFDSSYNVYACTVEGLYRSINNGDDWTKIGNGADTCFAAAIQPNGTIYGSFYQPVNKIYRLLKSTNYGTNWIESKRMQATITHVGVNRNLDVYFICDSLYRSTDNGASWSVQKPSLNTLASMAFLSNSTILIGAEEGLLSSVNAGVNWDKNEFNDDDKLPKIRKVFTTKDDRIFVLSDLYSNFLYSANGQPFDTLKRSFNYTPSNTACTSPEGDVYISTSVIHRYFNPKTMKPPKVLSPKDKKGGLDLFPTITWSTAPKAELYQFELSTDNFFDFVIEKVTQSDTVYKIQKGLDYFTNYYIRIRSKTDGAYSAWSPVVMFTTNLPAPILISPIKDTVGIPVAASLLWHKANGSRYYKVQVAEDSLFANIAFESDSCKDTTITTTKLKYLTRYFWRIGGRNDDGDGGWSNVEKFRTTLPPPQLRKPENNSMELMTKVRFVWDLVPTGESYTIQIAKNDIFDPVIFEGATQFDTVHTLELLEYDTKYYWRIRSQNEDGTGDWSDTWNFTTVIGPITLITPENDSINTETDMFFQWGDESKAEFYHIQIAKDQNFVSKIVDDMTVVPNEFLQQQLTYFTDYFWRVRELRGTRQGLWSETRRFRTKMDKPRLYLPENNTQHTDVSLNLYWHRIDGGDYYTLELGKDPGFFTMVHKWDTLTETQQDIYDLDNNTQYFWRVRAYRADGDAGWSDTWNFTTELSTAVAGEFDRNSFGLWIFPNPAQNFAEIRYYLPYSQSVEIAVYDSEGREVIPAEVKTGVSGEQVLNVNVSSLSAGKYYAKLKTGSIVKIREFVVVR